MGKPTPDRTRGVPIEVFPAMLADVNFRAWGFGDILIAVIVFFAVVAIAYLVITKGFGMAIPPWLVQVFWIVVAACVGIVAIKFVLSL